MFPLRTRKLTIGKPKPSYLLLSFNFKYPVSFTHTQWLSNRTTRPLPLRLSMNREEGVSEHFGRPDLSNK